MYTTCPQILPTIYYPPPLLPTIYYPPPLLPTIYYLSFNPPYNILPSSTPPYIILPVFHYSLHYTPCPPLIPTLNSLSSTLFCNILPILYSSLHYTTYPPLLTTLFSLSSTLSYIILPCENFMTLRKSEHTPLDSTPSYDTLYVLHSSLHYSLCPSLFPTLSTLLSAPPYIIHTFFHSDYGWCHSKSSMFRVGFLLA